MTDELIMFNYGQEGKALATILLHKKERVEEYGEDPYIEKEMLGRTNFIPNYVQNFKKAK